MKKIGYAVVLLLTLFCLNGSVLAGVGNTNSGGSSHTGGGYSGGSGGGGSYSSSYDSSSGGGESGPFEVVIFGAAALYLYRKNKNEEKYNKEPESRQQTVEKIKLIYPDFDEYDFLSYTKELYLSLQTAWMDKDWERARGLETESLFRQHQAQLQEYIDKHMTNHLDRVNIDKAIIKDFEMSDDYDCIRVILSSYLVDYIRDDETGELLEGDPTAHLFTVYNMEFLYICDEHLDKNDYSQWRLNVYEVVDEEEFYNE